MSGPVHPDWDKVAADWPNRDHSHFTQIGPVRWHYQRMGSGPLVLLLHGAGAATHSWRDLMPVMAQNFDVIAPDLPGHGFTRIQSRQQCSLPAMAQAVGHLVKHLGAAPICIVGHSAGTAIALQAVATGQITPNNVIGLNAALAPFRGLAGVLFPPMAKLLALNPFVPWVFSSLAGGPASARRLIQGTGSNIDDQGHAYYARLIARSDHVDGALSMMALWNLDPLLSKLGDLTVPVDLIVGEGDRTVPPAEVKALSQRHPNFTLKSVPELGHLMHEEDPGMFAEMIQNLIEQNEPPQP